MSIKEKKKKVYVKPAITVAEWDFNEAVCDDNIMLLSNCNRLTIEGTRGASATENRNRYTGGSVDNWRPAGE